MLAGRVVLDVSGPLGHLCGKILGDLGADVIKVEPPDGDPARMLGPFYEDKPDPNRNLFWWAYNNNKRGITLNLGQERGRQLFRQLAARADMVIESFPPGTLAGWGLDYPALAALNPGLILVSVTPFGQTGPRAQWQAEDLEVWALSGMMSLVGEPDGAPMNTSIPQARLWAGAEAAMGALLALYHRGHTGRGQHVDVSAQAAAISALAHAPAFWDIGGDNPRRAGIFMTGRNVHGARLRVFWPCRDGWINFILYGGVAGARSNSALVAWMAERGAAPESLRTFPWSEFNPMRATQAEIDVLEAPITRFFLSITKAEFRDETARRGIMGFPVQTAADIATDPQLAARQFWQTVHHPDLGRSFTYPGGFARFSAAHCGVRRPAPRIGEHNAEVYAGLGLTESDLAALTAAGVV